MPPFGGKQMSHFVLIIHHKSYQAFMTTWKLICNLLKWIFDIEMIQENHILTGYTVADIYHKVCNYAIHYSVNHHWDLCYTVHSCYLSVWLTSFFLLDLIKLFKFWTKMSNYTTFITYYTILNLICLFRNTNFFVQIK